MLTKRFLFSLLNFQERFNEQLILLNEAKSIFEMDATMKPTIEQRFQQIKKTCI